MGDAHPSLAPQWLKSGGGLSLRPQTQSGSNGANADEPGRNSSWRESGSRLGLGAGTDREAYSESRSSMPSALHRERSSFADRGMPRGAHQSFKDPRAFQPGVAERKAPLVRGPNAGSHRQMSDRELLEQAPSPSGRLGMRSGGSEPFLEDTHPSPSALGDRGRIRSQPIPRKSAGSQRNTTGLLTRGAERELSVLTRPPQQRGIPGGLLSPRHSAAEQPWTSRLADVGTAASQPESLPSLSSPSNAISANTTDASAKSAPRMADTILQAQANAAQEQEAAKAAKARMEQLVLRQSKQLVPVMPNSKAKQSSGSTATEKNLLSLKKSSGLEPLGKVHMQAAAARKEDDSLHSTRSMPHQGLGRPGMLDKGNSISSPKAIIQSKKPAREKDRLTFFSSLRQKASGGEQPGSEDNSLRQGHRSVSEPSQAKAAGTVESVSPYEDHNPFETQHTDMAASMPERTTNGAYDEASIMTPEELAFMRSLGWKDAEEDAGGGLTEEEVAAFKAQYPACNKQLQAFKISMPEGELPFLHDKDRTGNGTRDMQGRQSSLQSELAFSESSDGS